MLIKKLVLVVGICAIGLLTGCSSVYDKHVQWQQVKPESFPVLHAIGQAPISLQKSKHKTQRMLMAINASKIAAYAELAEQVYGQHIKGQTTVADLLLEDQSLVAKVQGIVRGARVVKSYPVGDTYTTELSLDFAEVYQLTQVTSSRKEIKDVNYY